MEDKSKPRERDCKKDKRSKSRSKKGKKKKKDNDDVLAKNTCPHSKKFQCKKPHHVNPDKCMWNKRYTGYSFCNKLKVVFKPRHTFTAKLGGYAKNEDSESK